MKAVALTQYFPVKNPGLTSNNAKTIRADHALIVTGQAKGKIVVEPF